MNADLLGLIRRLRSVGVKLSAMDGQLNVAAPKDALDIATVRTLRDHKAEVLEWLNVLDGLRSAPTEHTLPKATTEAPAPATDGQLGMWLLAQRGLSEAYHVAAALQLDGALNVAALQQAWSAAVSRHAGLRTRLVEREGSVWQQVDVQGTALALTDAIGEAGHALTAAEHLQRFAAPAFDLAHEAPARVRLVRQREDQHLLLLCLHHAAIDGWSLRLLLAQLALDYERALRGEALSTQPPERDLTDLALWQQQRAASGADSAGLAYWHERLAALESPMRLDECALPDGGFRAGQHLFELPAPLAAALQRLSAGSGITLYHWLLASFKLLLAKYSGSREVALLVPVVNRDSADLQALVGLLANTMPSVSQIDSALTLRAFAASESHATLQALPHQAVPFERVVRHCRSQGIDVPGQVMFSLQTVSENDLALGKVHATLVRHLPENAKFDLTLTIEQRGERLTGLMEYRRALFEAWQIDALTRAFEHVLAQAAQAPDEPMARFALAAPQTSSDTTLYAAVAEGVPNAIQQIAAQVARTPASTAITHGGGHISYGELWRQVSLAAARLQQAGVRAGDHVGVLLPPGPMVVVAALAVLAVGAAYAPLDPNQPTDRLAHMVGDAALDAVFAGPGSKPLGSTAWLPLDIDTTSGADTTPAAIVPLVPYQAGPLDTAYLIFTSGSTGLPKAAKVHQRGLTQLLQWYCQSCVDAHTRALIISNPSFDLTQKNLLAPLTAGGRVCWPNAPRFEPQAIAQALQTEQATLVNCTPTAFQALLASTEADGHVALSSLRTVVLGGEPIAIEPLRRWQRNRPAGQSVRIINSYGPTECADVVAWEALAEDLETALVPVALGRAVPGCLLDVVDPDGRPLPAGAVGELRIDGDCVGLGYMNRDELTQRVFQPGGHGITGRRFASGDYVRRLADGRLHYLGRRDHQVKFHGHRIELGEIESALLSQSQITQAAVALRHDTRGTAMLVAFYALRDPSEPLDEGALRGALSTSLAPYQVPTRYVLLPQLPLTRSGKIDRNALPTELPEPVQAEGPGAAPTLAPFERRLAELWQSLLGSPSLPGPQDNFFALGGHSLLAIQMIAQARQVLGVDWTVQQVFDAPTLASLAATPGALTAAFIDAVVPIPRDGVAPLSLGQQRLWFLDRIEGASAAYHIAGALQLNGTLHAAELERALHAIVERHEVLRTRFEPSDTSTVVQRFVPSTQSGFVLERADLCALQADPKTQQSTWWTMADEEAARPFDLAREAPLRARLLALGPHAHVLLVTMHHIVSDGWSISVLVRELGALYGAFVQQQSVPLARLAVQYADYAHWQLQPAQRARTEEQLNYWRQQLAGIPQVHNLPLDFARPVQQRFAGAQHRSQLTPALTVRLREFCLARGATLFMGLHAAFSAVLSRFGGETDIVVGTPVANREQPEVADLIGFFVNTLVLRADLSARPSFAALLDQCRRTGLEAQAHQQLPFDRLVEALQPHRSLSYTPLFQVMLSLQPQAEAGLHLPGLDVQPLSLERRLTQFDLSLDVTDAAGGLQLSWEYSTDLWEAASVARLAQCFERLLTCMLDAAACPIDQLPLLDEAGQQQMILLGQGEHLPLPAESLHQIFEAHARKHPDAPAVVDSAGAISYGALDRQARHLARRLLAAGVAPQVRVGVYLPRVSGLLASLIALWEIGAVYVPLSPDYPADRLRQIIDDAGIRHVLTSTSYGPALALLQSAGGLELLLIDERSGMEPPPEGGTGALPACGPEQAAYQLYTSGSTGVPKGVVVSHRNVVAYLTAARALYPIGRQARVMQFANISFDIFIEEVALSLLSGGSLHLRGDSDVPAPDAFWQAVAAGGLNVVSLPTAYWHVLCDELTPAHAVLAAQQLSTCIVGGEAMRPDALRRWQAVMPTSITLFNTYGPTETTIIATADRVDGADDRVVTIGRALANYQCYVLDAAGQMVPPGVIGELFVGGPAVTQGYWRQDQLTAQRFLPHPFESTPGNRCYRTGDLVSWRTDGRLRYHGRGDQQVKIRGFRVELGEIESALRALPVVRDACVLAVAQAGGAARIAAYVVTDDPTEQAIAVRQHLAEVLPDYMLPSALVRVDALPLTPNGKIDRNSLPPPTFDAEMQFVAPATPCERELAALWEELLQPGRPVSSTDNFFALGGHSLLALNVVRLLRERMNCHAGVDLIFRHPTLAELALAVAAQARPDDTGVPALPMLSEADRAPLTSMQRRQWILFRLEGPNSAYNMACAYRLVGHLDAPALRQAVCDVASQHWILRSRLVQTDGADLPKLAVEPVAQVRVDTTTCAQAQAKVHIAGFFRTQFDLSTDLLSRFELLHVDDGNHYLLANVHHIACDGLSLRTLLRDLTLAYRARAHHGAPWQPARAVQFAELAVWQEQTFDEAGHRRTVDELAATLRDAPSESALPLDAPRASADRNSQRTNFTWSAALTERIRDLARRHDTTPFNVLLASWAWVMSRLRCQPDLVFGVPIACRDLPGSEDVIGPLLNTLAVRVDCTESPTFAALLARTSAALAYARERRNVPFEDLVDAINPPRSLNLSPLFQTQFVLDPEGDEIVALDERLVAHQLSPQDTGVNVNAKYDLNIHVLDGGNTLRGYLDYRSALYHQASMQSAIESWRHLLEQVCLQPELPLGSLGLLGAEGARNIATCMERTDPTLPMDLPVHRLFELQVDRTPDAPALDCQNEGLVSYRELDECANQLAQRLVEAGVLPGERVAVAQHRGASRVVTLLAILKSGAAYLPIDPDWPASRRTMVLAQVDCRFLVVDTVLHVSFDGAASRGGTALHRIPPYGDSDAARPTRRLALKLAASAPCYQMFTSGSTGVPKGVVIAHGGVTHDLLFLCRKLGLGPGHRVLQLTAFSFDPSVRDLFATLGCGACAVLLDDESARQPARIIERVCRSSVSHVLSMVPTMLRALLSEAEGRPLASKLQVLMLNGERLRGDDCSRACHVFGENLRLVNQYGPTEATMTSATHDIVEDDLHALTVPLGRPNPNTALWVMDADGRPMPLGGIGEIWVTGPGLAGGYDNLPEQTLVAFVQTRLPHEDAPRRFYRTGDLARWRSDGILEFLGRIDFQVKLRGHRIELGEIDACLGQQRGIGHCATTLHEDDDGRQWLCAFYTAVGEAPDIEAVRKAMSARLPAVMVPALFILQPTLPLTASGKVDRKRLPEVAPFLAHLEQCQNESLDEVESQVAEVWVSLLRLKAPPSRNANFFELGANSLLMVQARDRLATMFGSQLSVVDLFEHPTIAALAANLRTGLAAPPEYGLRAASATSEIAATPLPPPLAHAGLRRAQLQVRAAHHAAARQRASLDTEETS